MTSMAFPMPAQEFSTFDLEIKAIQRMRKRFSFLTVFTILVSFVHMAASLILFSSENYLEQGAALLMTILVDIVTWMVASYIDYARVRDLDRSGWALALFFASLIISALLNFAYLYANRPPPEIIPYAASVAIAVAFAIFVPGTIAVSSVVSGELYRDLLDRQAEQIESTKPSVVSQPATLPDTPPVVPTALPSSNEASPRPPRQRQPARRSRHSKHKPSAASLRLINGNGKAAIMTSDIPAIIATLRDKNIRSFRTGAELSRILGWSSPSSGPMAIKNLLAAGAITLDNDVYVLAGDTTSNEADERFMDDIDAAFSSDGN
jgi:hypothetical protein